MSGFTSHLSSCYLCSECLLADGILTRLFRSRTTMSCQFGDPTSPTAFHCPANRGHVPYQYPPILIARWPRELAIVTNSPCAACEQREELETLATRVESALPAIFTAFDAIGDRRNAGNDLGWTVAKCRAVASLPHGWRLNAFS